MAKNRFNFDPEPETPESSNEALVPLEEIPEVTQGETKIIEFSLRFEPTCKVRKCVPSDLDLKPYRRAGYQVTVIDPNTNTFDHYISR